MPAAACPSSSTPCRRATAPTRRATTDTGADRAPRNGEPDGEIGLIIQQDHGYWQDQTGAPERPAARQHPRRRARRPARRRTSTTAHAGPFAVDSGVWEVTGGALQVGGRPRSGRTRPPSSTSTSTCRSTTRSGRRSAMQKPTGGWKANAYVIFDYWSPTDFKFAGHRRLDQQDRDGPSRRDRLGRRRAVAGAGLVKADTCYNVLVAVNGTTVTVSRQRARSAFTLHVRGAGHRRRCRSASTRAWSASARTTRAASWTTSPCRCCRPSSTLDSTRASRTAPAAVHRRADGYVVGQWRAVRGTPAAAGGHDRSTTASGDGLQSSS